MQTAVKMLLIFEGDVMQIKDAYIVYINFDGDIKCKYGGGNHLVFTELAEVKLVITEALTDLMRHETKRGRAVIIEVDEYTVPIADILANDQLLELFIDTGGTDLGNWEIFIDKSV